ncbi:uncharacterized protein LOC126291459 [Schistocerca gregaria]|uniref:uncharacterized protein LOC126291459 n=1 Tax=Schistocerca gregaria TaxID=7010 RepID=UPI00211DA8D6|nr:uncharacterized protein LOC126291459 [Schistocerca gregaria]
MATQMKNRGREEGRCVTGPALPAGSCAPPGRADCYLPPVSQRTATGTVSTAPHQLRNTRHTGRRRQRTERMGERRQLRRLAAVWLLLLAALACDARPQDPATTKLEADNVITGGALPSTTAAAPRDSQKEKEVARDVNNSSSGALAGTRRWSPRRGSPALGPSIASVAGQLLQDTRTPPLVQQLRAQAELQHGQGQVGGQGEAVPVLLEEHELADERRVQQLVDRTRGGGGGSTARPQPGISTWVLLSGSNSSPPPEEPSTTTTTTAAPAKNKKNGAGSGRPGAGAGAGTGAAASTTAAPPPQKAAGGRKPPPGGSQTPRPPPSTAANNKFVQQFRPLLHSRPANPPKLATATSTARPQSTTTTTTSRTTTTSTTAAAVPATKKPPKTTTTTTAVPPPAKANRTAEPDGVQLLPALTRQPPSKAKPAPAAPTAAAFRRRPAANTTTTSSTVTTTTTTAAPQPTSTTAQQPAKAATNKGKTTTTTTTTTTTPTSVTIVAANGPAEAAEDSTETAPEETTTKRQRRPGAPGGGSKKRKKNKNKRRKRPTAQQEQQPAESKVTDLSPELKSPGNATRPAGNKEKRPLSTRIYNYLAREVMPSVGVGLIGLVVTAGLAGLMLYPFGGGVAARRTYEEEEATHRLRYPHQGGFLYYEGAGPDGKPEEAVLREVFEGMAPADEPISSYHQPQASDDSDGTYSYSAGPVASGYSGHHYSASYGAMASSTTPPSAGQPGPYYSGHAAAAAAAADYRRPQYHQRLEATPKHAATAASPVAAAGSVSPEKFYGSEAVHVRTADVPKYGTGDSSQAFSEERQRQQDKAIGYSVVAAGDRVGTVEVAYGGRVRHHQVAEASSAIAEHGPRSLGTDTGTVTVREAGATEATRIEARKRRDIAEDEVVSPDSLLLDNDIDVVWAKEKKWPPKKEIGSAKQPIKWINVDSSPVQDSKTSTLGGLTSTSKTNIMVEKSTNLPVTTESATPFSEADEETSSSTRLSAADMDSQTTTDQARLSEDTSGEPAVFVTEVVSPTEESHTAAPPNSTEGEGLVTLRGPPVEESPTNAADSSSASVQHNQMSFTDVLRRIAQFKMRLGLSLLKSTSEAFSRYLGTVQERMEETLAEARRARYQNGPGDGSAGVAFWNAVRRAQRGLFDTHRHRDE